MPTAIAMSTGSIRLNQAPQFSTIPHLPQNFEISQTKKSTEQPKTVHSEPEQPKAMRAALNNLDVFSCDIGNAYLNAPCKEKIWFEAGLECGKSLKGRVMKFCQALYGLKSSGASLR